MSLNSKFYGTLFLKDKKYVSNKQQLIQGKNIFFYIKFDTLCDFIFKLPNKKTNTSKILLNIIKNKILKIK